MALNNMKKSLLLLFLVTFKSFSFSFEENESIEVRWGYNEELNFLYLSYEDEVLFKSETDTNLDIGLVSYFLGLIIFAFLLPAI